jgi:hypothetical protein
MAEEFREPIGSEARACDEVKKLREVEEPDKSRAYQFALKVYGWTAE